jgi:hypothetical protein
MPDSSPRSEIEHPHAAADAAYQRVASMADDRARATRASFDEDVVVPCKIV